jgi:ABC-2 type transport system permease protein
MLVMSLAFGGLGAFAALRAGTAEAVQGLFPLMFAALFLSSTALPRPLIEIDWFRAITTANPVSYMLEGIRSVMITGWDGQALALAFGLTGAIAVVTLTASAMALRTRMAR